jgi:hypothetical protein
MARRILLFVCLAVWGLALSPVLIGVATAESKRLEAPISVQGKSRAASLFLLLLMLSEKRESAKQIHTDRDIEKDTAEKTFLKRFSRSRRAELDEALSTR